MTTSVGQVLQRARTQRGIDLYEVERVTKIRVQSLRAMEEDRWDDLAGPDEARASLETYARYLDLDPESLVEDHKGTRSGGDRSEPMLAGTIRPASRRAGGRSIRPYALLGAGIAAAVLIVLLIAGVFGGSGEGGASHQRARGSPVTTQVATTSTTGTGSQVSIDLRSTDAVWICLVDSDDRTLVAETLSPGQTRGPFDGRSFEVTFGNGSVDMTVDGQAAKVPRLAEPLGYRITPDGIHRLDPGSGPTCT
jgi:hypothetical protein